MISQVPQYVSHLRPRQLSGRLIWVFNSMTLCSFLPPVIWRSVIPDATPPAPQAAVSPEVPCLQVLNSNEWDLEGRNGGPSAELRHVYSALTYSNWTREDDHLQCSSTKHIETKRKATCASRCDSRVRQDTRLDDAGGSPVPVAPLHEARGALQAAVRHQSPALGAQVDAAEEEVLLVLVCLLCKGNKLLTVSINGMYEYVWVRVQPSQVLRHSENAF